MKLKILDWKQKISNSFIANKYTIEKESFIPSVTDTRTCHQCISCSFFHSGPTFFQNGCSHLAIGSFTPSLNHPLDRQIDSVPARESNYRLLAWPQNCNYLLSSSCPAGSIWKSPNPRNFQDSLWKKFTQFTPCSELFLSLENDALMAPSCVISHGQNSYWPT